MFLVSVWIRFYCWISIYVRVSKRFLNFASFTLKTNIAQQPSVSWELSNFEESNLIIPYENGNNWISGIIFCLKKKTSKPRMGMINIMATAPTILKNIVNILNFVFVGRSWVSLMEMGPRLLIIYNKSSQV